MAAPPDYYAALEIPASASTEQIRTAYKKAALKHHPDRVPADSPERPQRTKRFQQINDAYYTLSEPGRRREYDNLRRFGGTESDTDAFEEETPQPEHGASGASARGFPWSFFGNKQPTQEEEANFSNGQFGNVFEEMLREEGMAEGQRAQPTGKFWSMVGGLSGGAMGFIVANFPGAVAGAVAGNRLGAVRDAKGKSVYAVFQELPQNDKAKLLSDLAAKVFAHAVSA